MILRALLEATPEPPADADIEALLYAFDVMHAERQQLLDRLLAPIDVTDEDRDVARQIAEREARWQDALASARAACRQSRLNTGKLRSYASAQAGEL
jgi:hypothetical protein